MAQVVNGRLQTPMGVSKNLVFDLPASMINATKLENRIQPYGQSSFSQAGQIIKFVIPKTDRAFANGQTMYITGKCDLSGAFTGAAAGTDFMYVLGSYWSHFSRYVVSSNGKVLETIERPSELINMMLNMTLNPAERKGLANSLGFFNDIATSDGDVTLNICQPINTGTASVALLPNNGKTWTFALPLIGLLNCAKQIPLINGDIQIELTINSLANWLVGRTDLATTAIGATVAFALTEMELVFDQLQLTPESYAMVMAAYPEKMYIKSESFDFGSGSPITGAGSVDIPVNSKRSSLKQVLCYFNQTYLVDKTYGGINPNASDIVFITNGQQYPQRPIKLNNPSECYMQVQKSFGSIYSNNHSGSIGKAEFCRRNNTTGNNLYMAGLLDARGAGVDTTYGATAGAVGNIIGASNKFYISIDTELINYDTDSLYSGIPMGVNSNFRLNVANSLTLVAGDSCIPYFWLCYDAVIEFDLINGITNIIA